MGGEREMAADNKMLGQFDLVGIPPAPRGMPQIEVTFDIDANGIVNVSAKDKATNKQQQIQIQSSGGLSDDDIERMVKDAEANADADRIKREAVELKNEADSLLHSTEKSFFEHKDKVQADIDAVKAAMNADPIDSEDLKTKVSALQESSMKIGAAMYGSAEGGSSGGDGAQEAE